MFERMRRILVESFVGAIALGYLLAQSIMHFVNIFASWVEGWLAEKQIPELTPGAAALWLRYSVPELIRSCLLVLIWYLLLRWLYFNPRRTETSEPTPIREEAD